MWRAVGGSTCKQPLWACCQVSVVGLQPLLASQVINKEEQDRVEESKDKLELVGTSVSPSLATVTFRLMALIHFHLPGLVKIPFVANSKPELYREEDSWKRSSSLAG